MKPGVALTIIILLILLIALSFVAQAWVEVHPRETHSEIDIRMAPKPATHASLSMPSRQPGTPQLTVVRPWSSLCMDVFYFGVVAAPAGVALTNGIFSGALNRAAGFSARESNTADSVGSRCRPAVIFSSRDA